MGIGSGIILMSLYSYRRKYVRINQKNLWNNCDITTLSDDKSK